FVYRDYAIQGDGREDRLIEMRAQRVRVKGNLRLRPKELPPPAFLADKPVWRGERRVADLPTVPRPRLDFEMRQDEEEEEDGDYFDDDCEDFRERLEKTYRPRPGRPSSWRCDRVVEVPGGSLREAGAYVLAVEVNGQAAYVPLVVDPLSL